jgi:hypothetical protein
MAQPVISAAVMAHPSRLPHVRRMIALHQGLDWQVAVDPEPGKPYGSLRTATLAWSLAPAWATHHLVVQDDVVLVPDFERRLAAAVALHPASALSLFVDWNSCTSAAARIAALSGARWFESADGHVPSQALVMPAGLARGFAAFADGHWVDGSDDTTLLAYLGHEHTLSLCCVPSLAEHCDGASLLGHDYHGSRKSVCLLGPEHDAPTPGDAGPLVTDLPRLPAFHCHEAFMFWRCRHAGGAGSPSRYVSELPERGGADGLVASVAWQLASGCDADLAAAIHGGVPTLATLLATVIWLGLIASRQPGAGVPGLAADPVAAEAMATMVPGHLELLAEPAGLPQVCAELGPVIWRAVEAGRDLAAPVGKMAARA